MRKRMWLTLCTMAMLLAALCGCTAKLTTVRPSEISEMRVTRMTDGETAALPTGGNSAELMETLIFQLEEPYDKIGSCAEADGHLYRVELYIGDKLDTEVVINQDGSVCKNGKRRTPSGMADSPVDLAAWNALFAEGRAAAQAAPPTAASRPSLQQPEPSEPDAETDPLAFSEGDMGIVAAQGSAKQLPAGAEILDVVPICDVPPWSYYIGGIRYDGQEFVMVWRDTPKGEDAQWICSVAQTSGDTALQHSIEYAAGSYERSGENYLYFTVTDAANFHRSLWCFDPETTYFNRVLDAPCSNLLLLEHEPHEAQGVGWIAYDHYLAAVELAVGSTDEGLTIDLDEYIDDHLFYGIGAFGTHKYAMLYDLGNNALQLEGVIAEPETSAPELRTVYQFDILTHKFSEIAR